jgi:hypothetical protein
LQLTACVGRKCADIATPQEALKQTLVVEIIVNLGKHRPGCTGRKQENYNQEESHGKQSLFL